MNTFFGSIFIERERLREAGIDHPIKLEYYKIINEDEFIKKNNAKYGIKIVKTEYIKNNTKIEDKTIKHLSNNEQRVEEILSIFKENEVTPVCVEDIIYDYSKKLYLI